MKRSDLEMAFEFVSSDPHHGNEAYVSRSTGQVYWRSDAAGEDDVPEDAEGSDLVEIPHKNDLDLGRRLVWQFVEQEMPDHHDRVAEIFSSRGAYQRFKRLLEQAGKLDSWYRFEETRTREALQAWCEDNGIILEKD